MQSSTNLSELIFFIHKMWKALFYLGVLSVLFVFSSGVKLKDNQESNSDNGFTILGKIFEKQQQIQQPNVFQQIQQLEKKEYKGLFSSSFQQKNDPNTFPEDNATEKLQSTESLSGPVAERASFTKLFTGTTKSENSYQLNAVIDPIKLARASRKVGRKGSGTYPDTETQQIPGRRLRGSD
jgi:hypothetical protein